MSQALQALALMCSDHEEVGLVFDSEVHNLEVDFTLAGAHQNFKSFQSGNR